MYKEDLLKKIKELVNFRLEKGVSPYELVTNIEDEDYKEYTIKRIKSGYICSIKFTDIDDSDYSIENIIYQYIYDNDMYLLKINSVKNNRITAIWNRKDEEYKKLSGLLKEFNYNDIDKKNKFIDTLPLDLRLLLDEKNIKVV